MSSLCANLPPRLFFSTLMTEKSTFFCLQFFWEPLFTARDLWARNSRHKKWSCRCRFQSGAISQIAQTWQDKKSVQTIWFHCHRSGLVGGQCYKDCFCRRKGLFIRNTIFASRRVARQCPTWLGLILIWSDPLVRHGATHNCISCKYQSCKIFLGTTYQNGNNIQNGHKIY
jgi:hypothetical protein